MNNYIKAKWWWNIPILFMIILFVSLGIRSIYTEDNRYGWGTFSKQIVYELKYYWVTEDGKKTRYIPGGELLYDSKNLLDGRGNTRYSIGAVKSWVNNYIEYLYINKKPGPEVISVLAELEYVENISRRKKWYTIDEDKFNKIIFKFPKQEDE